MEGWDEAPATIKRKVEGWDKAPATIKRKEAPLREGEEKNGTEKDKGQ